MATSYLEDTGNQGRPALDAASNDLAARAAQNPDIADVRGNTKTRESQLRIIIDQEKAGALGVDINSANSLIGAAFAGSYVNDFVRNGEIKPVYVQADAPHRMQADDVERWYARNAAGGMVPFSAFTRTE